MSTRRQAPEDRKYRWADFIALPDDDRRELIDGALGMAFGCLGAAAADVAPQEAQIFVDASAVTWSRDRVAVTVEQRGALAGKRLLVSLFVDGNRIDDYPTTGGVTRIEVAGLELEPGAHRLLAKSGTHESADRFRYVPALWLAGAALVAAAVAVGLVVLRRRSSASG